MRIAEVLREVRPHCIPNRRIERGCGLIVEIDGGRGHSVQSHGRIDSANPPSSAPLPTSAYENRLLPKKPMRVTSARVERPSAFKSRPYIVSSRFHHAKSLGVSASGPNSSSTMPTSASPSHACVDVLQVNCAFEKAVDTVG